MSESNPIVPPGPAPSKTLLDKFAVEADKLRMQAADHKVTASAAHEAHQVAAGEADELSAHYQHLLAEMERLRKLAEQARADLDAKLKAADEHRERASHHGAAADELLGDASYLDGVVARAKNCPCGGPDAAAYDEQRETCPIHHRAPAPPALVSAPVETRTDPPPPPVEAQDEKPHTHRIRGSKRR